MFNELFSIIINQFKELVAFQITSGNVADNNPELIMQLTQDLIGKIFGDRGYQLNSFLQDILEARGVKVVSRGRNNMKNKKLSAADERVLKNRWSIETVGNLLKSELSLEHSRHRSLCGCLTHIITCLMSYFYYAKNVFKSLNIA